MVGLVGIGCYPMALVGAVLGLRAFLELSKTPGMPGRRVALLAMLMPGLLLPVLALEGAVMVPAARHSRLKKKQVECKQTLAALWRAEEQFHQRTGRWTDRRAELGFEMQKGNRYTYFLSLTEGWPADSKRHPKVVQQEHVFALGKLGIEPGLHGDTLTLACIGNVDRDDRLDVWTVSSDDREGRHGGVVPAGELYNDVSDD